MTDEDPAFEIARALANDQRSFRAIGDAFDAASEDAVVEMTPADRIGILTRALIDRYMEIDQISLTRAMIGLTGYLAQRSGRTPRQIHEELFKTAPADSWWDERIQR